MLDIASLRAQVADGEPDRITAVDFRVRDEDLTGGVDGVHDRGVEHLEPAFIETRRRVAKTHY
jgi:hypothetical protein